MKWIFTFALALALPVVSLTATESIGIDTLVSQSAELTDEEITVAGHVDRVSTERRLVLVIDLSEAGCADACSRNTLAVQIAEGLELPAKGENIAFHGRLIKDSNPLRLEAVSLEKL